MANFLVDSTQITQMSAQTTALATRMREDSAMMMSYMQNLQGSWSGAASAAFSDCVVRWRAAQMQMETALDSISQALAHASIQYEQTESGIAGMFSAH